MITQHVLSICHFIYDVGFGKSITFQALPWYYDEMKGQSLGTSTLLVVSPLKALIADQMKFLSEKACVPCVSLSNDELDDNTFEGLYLIISLFLSSSLLLL